MSKETKSALIVAVVGLVLVAGLFAVIAMRSSHAHEAGGTHSHDGGPAHAHDEPATPKAAAAEPAKPVEPAKTESSHDHGDGKPHAH